MIVGQIFAESVAPEAIRSSMQALIFAATTGVGLFFGTQFAGIVMDKNSVDGKFQWSKVWLVPCVITLVGVLVLAALFQNPTAQPKPAANPDAPVSRATPPERNPHVSERKSPRSRHWSYPLTRSVCRKRLVFWCFRHQQPTPTAPTQTRGQETPARAPSPYG